MRPKLPAALLLLWSKPLIISNHVYASDCILPCFISVPLFPFTHLICYVFSLLPPLHFFITFWVFNPLPLSSCFPVFLCSTTLLLQPNFFFCLCLHFSSSLSPSLIFVYLFDAEVGWWHFWNHNHQCQQLLILSWILSYLLTSFLLKTQISVLIYLHLFTSRMR